MSDQKVDEELYSRQLYVYGKGAQQRLGTASVLIVGLTGEGAEAAKNIVLAGVKRVGLLDPRPALAIDLASNCFLTEDDVRERRSRANAVSARLQELNDACDVHVVDAPAGASDVGAAAGASGLGLDVDASALDDRTVILACGLDGTAVRALGSACRDRGIPLVACGAPGLIAWCFVDGGGAVHVDDMDGEDPKQGLVVGVTRREHEDSASTLVLELDPDVRHGLETGHSLTLSGMEGPAVDALNMPSETGTEVAASYELEVVDVPTPHSVDVGADALVRWEVAEAAAGVPSGKGSGYVRGGYFQQVKRPVVLVHRGAADFFPGEGEGDGPGVCPEPEGQPDLRRFERPRQLLAVLRALWMARSAAVRGGSMVADGPVDPECIGWPMPGDRKAAEALAAEAIRSLEIESQTGAVGGGVGERVSNGSVVSSEDRDALFRLAGTAMGRIAPQCTAAGAVAGQEVIKLITCRFTPLSQWWLRDGASALPQLPAAGDSAFTGSRYDGQIAVFGRGFQTHIEAARVFLVGSGALGCEFLKAFALMGLGAGGGLRAGDSLRSTQLDMPGVLVTDMDRIERSNLSRQFLFRDRHIGQPKSTAAAQAANEINPALTVEALETMVAPHTETLLPHAFWRSLTVVVNALDNIKARQYVDDQCVEHALPLLDSGTLGLKCSTMTVLPGLTETYSMGPSEGEDDASSIPVCTLKSFPHLPEHTLQWARDLWEDVFVNQLEAARDYAEAVGAVGEAGAGAGAGGGDEMEGRRRWLRGCKSQQGAVLRVQAVLRETRTRTGEASDASGAAAGGDGSNSRRADDSLPVGERPESFSDCIRWARVQYERKFTHAIQDLLHQYPADKVTADGSPFWTAKKKPPSVARFSTEDPLSRAFVLSGALVRARAHGVPVSEEEHTAAREACEGAAVLDQRGGSIVSLPPLSPSVMESFEAAEASVPAWVPSGEKIAGSEEEAAAMAKAAAGEGGDEDESEDEADRGGTSMDDEVDTLAKALPMAGLLRGPAGEGFQLQPQPFDKDDDAGMHADFVSACGNLRSRQYGIPVVERLRAKKVVGRIVPAVATTTALATALVGLEIIKVIRLAAAMQGVAAAAKDCLQSGRSALSARHMQWLGGDKDRPTTGMRGGIARPLVAVHPPIQEMLPATQLVRAAGDPQSQPSSGSGDGGAHSSHPLDLDLLLAAFDQHNVNLALNMAQYFEPRPAPSMPISGQGTRDDALHCSTTWDSVMVLEGEGGGAQSRGMPSLLTWLYGHLESGALTGESEGSSLGSIMFDGVMVCDGDDREEAEDEEQPGVGASCLEALVDTNVAELDEGEAEEREADMRREGALGTEVEGEGWGEEEAERLLVKEKLEKRGRGLDWWRGLRQLTMSVIKAGGEMDDEDEDEDCNEDEDNGRGDQAASNAGDGDSGFPRLTFVPCGSLLNAGEEAPLR